MTSSHGRAAENPQVLTRLADILARAWDPAATVRDALRGGGGFYREQALMIAGMLAADAQATEVQRYLRQLEQQAALPATLHPNDARHAIALELWEAARSS